MKKCFQSIWFPICVFSVLEVIAFLIGLAMTWQAVCLPCPSTAEYCPPCPSGNYSWQSLEIGIIPSAAVAIVLYVAMKRRMKKTDTGTGIERK